MAKYRRILERDNIQGREGWRLTIHWIDGDRSDYGCFDDEDYAYFIGKVTTILGKEYARSLEASMILKREYGMDLTFAEVDEFMLSGEPMANPSARELAEQIAEYAMVQSMLPDGMTLQEVVDDCYYEGE